MNETKRLLLSLIDNSFKIFLIVLLLFALLFSISCKSNEEPNENTLSNYAGTWYDKDNPADEVIVINSDGSITINDVSGATKITDITKNSDTNYSFYYGEQKDNSTGTEIIVKAKFTVNFSSNTEGTITITCEGTLTDGTTITVPAGTVNIIKK